MASHRILMANDSRFLREILKHAFEKAQGLSVVGEITDPDQLVSSVERTDADWVVVSLRLDGSMPASIETLLTKHSAVRILGVARDGSQVKMKWIEPREDDLHDPSISDLIGILLTDSPNTQIEPVDPSRRN